MKIIGITGPSGAGKSLLCRSIAGADIPCIDADSVYHSLLIPPSECLSDIEKAFGKDVIAPDGSLDRARLGQIVFRDEEKLDLLNKTVHGYVTARISQMIGQFDEKGYAVVALDAPTLIESGFNRECDFVVSVLAPVSARIERIMERDSISREKAEMRTRAQKSDEFYIGHSDTVIYNDASAQVFAQRISELLSSDIFCRESEVADD